MSIYSFFSGLLIAIISGFLFWGIIRKLAARMHNRVGPPIWQPILDFTKLLQKETITPRTANRIFIDLGVLIALLSIIGILIFIPNFGNIIFEYDMIAVIYLLLASAFGFCLAGIGSNNPYSSLGTIREIIQLIALEPALIISLITVGLLTSFSIVSNNLFLYIPFTFLAFLLVITAELKIPPFHIPEAEQELVSGLFTEITGKRLAVFQLTYALKLFVLLTLTVVLFLAGGSILDILAKSLVLVFILTILRVIFSRLRIDQSLRFFWLIVIPLALIDFVRMII